MSVAASVAMCCRVTCAQGGEGGETSHLSLFQPGDVFTDCSSTPKPVEEAEHRLYRDKMLSTRGVSSSSLVVQNAREDGIIRLCTINTNQEDSAFLLIILEISFVSSLMQRNNPTQLVL